MADRQQGNRGGRGGGRGRGGGGRGGGGRGGGGRGGGGRGGGGRGGSGRGGGGRGNYNQRGGGDGGGDYGGNGDGPLSSKAWPSLGQQQSQDGRQQPKEPQQSHAWGQQRPAQQPAPVQQPREPQQIQALEQQRPAQQPAPVQQPREPQQSQAWGQQRPAQQSAPVQQPREPQQIQALEQQRLAQQPAPVQQPREPQKIQALEQQRPAQQPQQQPLQQVDTIEATPRAAGAQRPHRGATGSEPNAREIARKKRLLKNFVQSRPDDSKVSKQGHSGKQIQLQTNYFRVQRKDNEAIFQYRVDFNPSVESIKMMHSIMTTLKSTIGGYIFEGTQLFSRHKLGSDEVEIPTKEPITGNTYIVKLRKVGEDKGVNERAFVIYNLINRKAMACLRLQLIRRNYFDPVTKVPFNDFHIDLYPGYVTSIRQHEKDVLMCADITHRVMHTNTCYTMLEECVRQGGNWRDNYKSKILGMVVMAIYGKNNTYRIADVDFNTCPESKFDAKGEQITYLQYFRDRYNITIDDPRQPMLVSRARQRDIRAGNSQLIYLVPELVRATGLTDEMRMDFNLMRGLANVTRMTPEQRIERLEALNDRLQKSGESMEVFKFWKTELDRRLVEVPGRLLPPEEIFFNEDLKLANHNVSAGASANWQSSFRTKPMYLSFSLKNWYVIVKQGSEKIINHFIEILRTVSRGMLFNVEMPHIFVIHNEAPNYYVDALTKVIQKDPQMIMCLVSNDKADRYAAIKKKCCVDRAVPTQVIRTKTITGEKPYLMSVATKVAIQMNCKLGGIPWVLKTPLKTVMVIGFDVCHDAGNKSKSYGAMVASMYGFGTQHPKFFSTVNNHSNGEELSNFMAQNVFKALQCYRKEFNNALPQRVVIYRDGVGDGQLPYVYEHEVKAVKDTLNHAYKGEKNPSMLMFCVVSKRINTRLFERRKNPLPGTIVDNIITLPERTDFFLVSQSVRQGTVSPTSYNVLYDKSGLSADNIQTYTYKQTHLYYNWSGTVGVPAVCQYAHKLAFLAGQYLHQSPNHLLENKLYYL